MVVSRGNFRDTLATSRTPGSSVLVWLCSVLGDFDLTCMDRGIIATVLNAICLYVLLVMIVSATGPFALGQQSSPVKPNGVAIENVLNEIQKGLVQAQSRIADLHVPDVPALDSVTLTLQTQYDAKGGPKFKLFVISFGATWERQRSNQLEVTLKPPKPHATVQMGKTQGLSDQLVEAIVSVADGVKNAPKRQPPLMLDALKAEFQFVIETNFKGGATFNILPVSAEVGGELSKKAVHKISVVFSIPKSKATTDTK